jgi:hypothetical protein
MENFTSKFNFSKKFQSLLKLIILLVFIVVWNLSANAANRYSVVTGPWGSTSTWSATSGGSPGASVPTSSDDVYIEGGYTVTIVYAASTGSASCLALNIANGSKLIVQNNLNVSATSTINGTITLGDANISHNQKTFAFGDIVINIGGTWDERLTVSGSPTNQKAEKYQLNGSLSNYGTYLDQNVNIFGVPIHDFKGFNKTINGTFTFVYSQPLWFESNSKYTNNGYIDCISIDGNGDGSMALSGNLIQGVGSTLKVSGSGQPINPNTVYYDPSATGNLTEYDGAGIQYIYSNYYEPLSSPVSYSVYYNLICNNTYAISLAGTIEVQNTLTLQGTVNLDLAGSWLWMGPDANPVVRTSAFIIDNWSNGDLMNKLSNGTNNEGYFFPIGYDDTTYEPFQYQFDKALPRGNNPYTILGSYYDVALVARTQHPNDLSIKNYLKKYI